MNKQKLFSNLIGIFAAIVLMFLYLFISQKYHKESERKEQISKQLINNFIDMYTDDFLELSNNNTYPLHTFKKSYYYPFTDDSPLIISTYFTDIEILELETSEVLSINYSFISALEPHKLHQSFWNINDYSSKQRYSQEEQNKQLLINYTTSVSDKISIINSIRQDTDVRVNIQYSAEKWNGVKLKHKDDLKQPNIQNELPINSIELDRYLEWICKAEGVNTPDDLTDIYGIPVKIELTDVGLKAISAGADMVFGTIDDCIYTNSYN